MTHTKGPWTLATIDSEPAQIMTKDGRLVTKVYGWPEMKEANARLIAAAPDMYKVLLEVEYGTVTDENPLGECPICACSMGKGHKDCPLDKAIRKAKA